MRHFNLTDTEQELLALFSSGRALMWLVTREELRGLGSLGRVAEAMGRLIASWDQADQWRVPAGNLPELKPGEPGAILAQIERSSSPALFVLKDFHHFTTGPAGAGVVRKLRNLSRTLGPKQQAIVILTPSPDLPLELRDDCNVFHFPLPTVRELRAALDDYLKADQDARSVPPPVREKLAAAAAGLSLNEAKVAFAKARYLRNGRLDEEAVGHVLAEKARVIKATGALEFHASGVTMDSVGGLWALKDWLAKREKAFGPAARDYRLSRPRGVLVFGIPGTGKSLVCKAVSSLWRWPLVRLDVGAVFGPLVGQSEENMRNAIRVVEAIAPCVLWLDEIEKAFGQGDAGLNPVHARVFGAFLTWMQEKEGDVFVVATANQVEALPLEFTRKGRFDEVFFVDLPSAKEREEIFRVHLGMRRPILTPYEGGLSSLVNASESYTGAEIEAAIDEAMYNAFSDDERDFTTQDILDALKTIKPLAQARPDEVERLRAWVQDGRARLANVLPEAPSDVARPLPGSRFDRATRG